jgi:hypothetical protein
MFPRRDAGIAEGKKWIPASAGMTKQAKADRISAVFARSGRFTARDEAIS